MEKNVKKEGAPTTLLPEFVKNSYQGLLMPLIRVFVKLRIHPNHFTVLGLLITSVAAVFLGKGYLLVGGILVLVGGTCDIIDGKVARATGYASRFGALFDSTLDRYSEVVAFFGVGFYFVAKEMYLSSIATFIALGGSMMVSYVRARSEGLGYDCKVGLMQRPERVVAIGFGAIFGENFLVGAMTLIAALANFTAIQRIWAIWNLEKKSKEDIDKNEDKTAESENT